jgi:hypothetical protein
VRHGVIYGLYAPDGELRYIGQTTKEPWMRLCAHLSPSSLRRHSYLGRWLGSLVAKGERPTIRPIVDAANQVELDRLEVAYIAAARAGGVRLVNLSNGGGGRSGYVPTHAEREKISAAQRGVPRKPHSEATRAHLSRLHRGRPSPNTREHHRRVAELLRGVPRSASTRAKISAAKIGHVTTPKHRAALSRALIGKPKAPDHVAKLTGPGHGMFRHDIVTDELVAAVRGGESVAGLARRRGLPRTFIHRRLNAHARTGP